MQKHDPETYDRILEGDRSAQQKHSGHGGAIAQVYSHMIMPLANRRDKETQIIWGLKDFESRFQRKAASIWLAETAVDLETLELMAQHGMQYVILAPRQAKRIRPIGDEQWQDAENETVESSRPYCVNLPNGARMTVFFYNGELSRAVAFEGVLHNGHDFARRIIEEFNGEDSGPRILNLATDGESYGHHHHHGDMALAYALDFMDNHADVTLTNYAEYLSSHAVEWEAEIIENSSWSCIHGIERWRDNCGCHSGYQPDWNQLWRAPLRQAFDFLRDSLSDVYADILSQHCDDPWAVRNDYISILLDGSVQNRNVFFERWFGTSIEADSALAEKIFKCLEMQRSLILMYTSCGWFFDEISGIETVQNLKYACRALEMAREACGLDLEDGFLNILENAPSNIEAMKNGRVIYELYVKPSCIGFYKLAANFSIDMQPGDHRKILYSHDFSVSDYRQDENGTFATLDITSLETTEKKRFEVRITSENQIDIKIRVKNRAEGKTEEFSLSDLLADQQNRLLADIRNTITKKIMEEWDGLYRQYDDTLKQLDNFNIALPAPFRDIAYHVQNERIHDSLRSGHEIKAHIDEFLDWDFEFDKAAIRKSYHAALEESFERLRNMPGEEPLRNFLNILKMADYFPFSMELECTQIDFYKWLNESRTAKDDWKDTIHEISQRLKILHG